MKRFVVLIMLVMWATGCSIGPSPKEVMGKYLDAFSESEGSEFMAIWGPKSPKTATSSHGPANRPPL